MKSARPLSRLISALCCVALCASPAVADMKMAETKGTVFSATAEVTTEVIMLENVLDLDTKIRDDRCQYLGLMYDIGFDIASKDEGGPELDVRLKRYGPYDYNVPAVINNTLNTSVAKVAPYTNAEYLPELGEFWADIPLGPTTLRFKPGLFLYSVGHDIALGGYYENYGALLYTENDQFEWHLYCCAPDYNNKNLLGPYIKQEKEQGIQWNRSQSSFWATDMVVFLGENRIQPYVGMLVDRSDGKRSNLFTTQTRDDLLGTVGIAADLVFGDLSVGLEWARNFGRADTTAGTFDTVEHQGYMFYADAAYETGSIDPHAQLIYASGNTLTTDMITNGDTTYTSGTNNAFSVYSPFNTFLADSLYSGTAALPLVAMGNGDGLSYGVARPGTFGDPICIDNLVLVKAGFDYALTKKASVTLDWWYLSSVEKGIGMYNGVPKVISPDLGHEFDIFYSYTVTEHIRFTTYAGIFLPGAAYREERTDVDGSLFTPFVRGDGQADPAYQAEFALIVSY